MNNSWRRVAIIALGGIILFAAAYVLGGYTYGYIMPGTNSLYNQTTVTSVYHDASPATVELRVGGNGRSGSQAEGSGFLVDTNGDILTNAHVVSGAVSVQVLFDSGKTVTGQVAGIDQVADLAVVKVDAASVSGITPLTLGDSGAVRVGQMVIAIGSPSGEKNTLSVGIISGIGRAINDGNSTAMTGMLQTDAAVSPGSSGGPLLNDQGQVVGIVTAADTTQVGRGYGFAIPSSTISSELPSLVAGQPAAHPWLGISGATSDQPQGVSIAQVVTGSPAAAAGLKVGDVITAIDGQSLTSIDDLTAYLNSKQVGDKVTLTVVSAGKTRTVSVTLAARPANI